MILFLGLIILAVIVYEIYDISTDKNNPEKGVELTFFWILVVVLVASIAFGLMTKNLPQ